jgi:sulfofructose kinase
MPFAKVLTLGWACLDQRFYVECFPPTHSRTPTTAHRETLGGPATVAAVAVARLGGEAVLLSRRGADPSGEQLERLLKAENVQAHFTMGARTPVSGVLVAPDGERYIFPYRGDLPTTSNWKAEEMLEGVQAILLDHRWPEAGLEIAKTAQAKGIPVVLDLDHDRPEAWQLAEHSSHIVASEELMYQVGGYETLQARLEAWTSVTLGSEGVRHPAGYVGAFKVVVKDSTGAGDVFHGAFTLAIAEGQAEVQALRFAAAVSALHVQNGEPPRREAVNKVISSSFGKTSVRARCFKWVRWSLAMIWSKPPDVNYLKTQVFRPLNSSYGI